MVFTDETRHPHPRATTDMCNPCTRYYLLPMSVVARGGGQETLNLGDDLYEIAVI